MNYIIFSICAVLWVTVILGVGCSVLWSNYLLYGTPFKLLNADAFLRNPHTHPFPCKCIMCIDGCRRGRFTEDISKFISQTFRGEVLGRIVTS